MDMPTHLTASMRVIRAHTHRPRLTVAEARQTVLDAAYLLGTGADVPESAALARKLEKATGCSIAELAIYADDWPAA